MTGSTPNEAVSSAVRLWVETLIVGLNLCPFAGREVRRRSVRYVVSDATSEDELLEALFDEFSHLDRNPETETTLLIHPQVLTAFPAYNQFLDKADALLAGAGLEGIYQVASFHPDYRFAGTAADDAENYTNRSPYPLLHLLRESSVERAAAGADVDAIPERNIELMNKMGTEQLRELLGKCRVE